MSDRVKSEAGGRLESALYDFLGLTEDGMLLGSYIVFAQAFTSDGEEIAVVEHVGSLFTCDGIVRAYMDGDLVLVDGGDDE